MLNERKTYRAEVSTPEQDKILDDLRVGLREWLGAAADKGVDHSLALTALMLFTASGASTTDIPKQAFIDLMGKYYDAYKTALKAQS
jgi:hypothetical protein